MEPVFEGGGVRVFHGDCVEVMQGLPDASVDAVVTDPPYGLEFMGREWDGADGFRRSLNAADVGRENVFGRSSRTSPEYRAGVLFEEWCELWAAECFRVLKPGGHMLAFGGSRTWHRLAAAVEDAGFEIRDSIAWLYGSGFPKSLDVSKAIDKAAGAERALVPATGGLHKNRVLNDDAWQNIGLDEPMMQGPDAVTDAAKVWQGWGTALKPAFEPIVVGRKPLAGTVAANVLAYGTGALNIDGARVATSEALGGGANKGMTSHTRHEGFARPWMDDDAARGAAAARSRENTAKAEALGRWPANVVLDESQAVELDKHSGILTSGANPTSRNSDKFQNAYGEFKGRRDIEPARGTDSGGASRFFPTFRYEAKAPGSERPTADGVAHPTVKPLDLMRWLVRLVTPPGGVVLEPFAGSGTTAEACLREGFGCIAIEREADYLPLILKRVQKDHAQSLFGEDW